MSVFEGKADMRRPEADVPTGYSITFRRSEDGRRDAQRAADRHTGLLGEDR
jgi:hypothetical protein